MTGVIYVKLNRRMSTMPCTYVQYSKKSSPFQIEMESVHFMDKIYLK